MLVFLSVTVSTKMAKLMVYRCLSGHMKSRLSLLNLLRSYILDCQVDVYVFLFLPVLHH